MSTTDGTPRQTTQTSRPAGAQDLRHLRAVAEHVRQVADSHRAAQLRCARQPRFEVSDRRLAVDEELVHERLPRSDREAAGAHERTDPLLRLRPDLEVVVDGRELAVEREAQPLVRLELRRARRRRRSTSEMRKDWNGRYHSRSQCVCGTKKTLRTSRSRPAGPDEVALQREEHRPAGRPSAGTPPAARMWNSWS